MAVVVAVGDFRPPSTRSATGNITRARRSGVATPLAARSERDPSFRLVPLPSLNPSNHYAWFEVSLASCDSRRVVCGWHPASERSCLAGPGPSGELSRPRGPQSCCQPSLTRPQEAPHRLSTWPTKTPRISGRCKAFGGSFPPQPPPFLDTLSFSGLRQVRSASLGASPSWSHDPLTALTGCPLRRCPVRVL